MNHATGILDANANKTPLGLTLPKLAYQRALDAISQLGHGLPCKVTEIVSPGIVTVAFAVDATPWVLQPVTMAIGAFKYITYPIAVGEIGAAVSVGMRTGGVTGLGAGTPRLTDSPANLATLYFMPLGTTELTTLDAEAVTVQDNLIVSPDKIGFFGNTKAAKKSLTGALSSVTDPAAQDVLQSIVDALCDAGYGLTTDSTS